ncbi:hypothetical protein HFTV1-gp41 [Haloferax tailed virus 1]|uniref:Uncharacterized protein n=1 Tax=Haloferax tailed virus 1 TaxID=2507575 RepID=A0A410N6X8_HFTV1|nr:hypothetical protein M1M17_gp41 [Haloferax tailed virus 1]QAS68874.1 hypothetical protein HFTV1-gp41 [Haloferax tailed virus 1]
MVDATLSRGGTSVDIPLVEEGGEILLSSTFGKPEVNVRKSGGSLNPRVIDSWSGLQTFQLVGKLYDYSTSHQLADLVKTASTTPLELQIPQDAYPDTVTVAPAAGQASALTLEYPAGRKDLVDVSLSLTRVDPNSVRGVGDQQATTPTTTGTGPVEVTAGGTTVQLPSSGLSVERTVGRPNDAVRRVPRQADPRYEVKAKVTNDVFTFSFETLDNIPATLNALTDNVFREQLGRDGVTLDFNGLLGLGSVKAIPVGSSPFRQVHQAGRGWVTVPTLEFRRIYSNE